MTSTMNGTPARKLIRQGTAALREASENFSYQTGLRNDAVELLEFAAGGEVELDDILPSSVCRKFERVIERRASGEPIPYITGITEFDGLQLTVKPGAFVPRWTTEAMAAEAVKRLRRRRSPVHVDLATGIGPVALAVANRVPHAKVHAIDLEPRAVQLARLNARKLGLTNVSCHYGDLFAPLPKRLKGLVDVITIHPPYVAAHEVKTLPNELKDFEPALSLTDRSNNGLALLERTAAESEEWLAPNGWLIVEIGTYLARSARAVIADYDFGQIESVVGPLKLNRIICARR